MQHYVLKMVGQPDIIATKTGVFSVKHVAYIMERRKIMISFILCLLLLTILFGIAYKITGAILKACVWLLILLPIGLILSGVGVIFCCTIILSIEEYLGEKRDFIAYEQNKLLRRAVERELEIIGEAMALTLHEL